jgi:CHASE3 domain sensor protein
MTSCDQPCCAHLRALEADLATEREAARQLEAERDLARAERDAAREAAQARSGSADAATAAKVELAQGRALVKSQRAALDALRLITVQMNNVVYNCKQGDAARWYEGREKLIGLQEQYDAWFRTHGAALRKEPTT